MGFSDFFGSGSRKPQPDVSAVSTQELWQRLMRLNNAAAPWRVRQGALEGLTLFPSGGRAIRGGSRSLMRSTSTRAS